MENKQDYQIFTNNHTLNLVENGANLLVANYLVHFALFEYKRCHRDSYVPFEFIRYYIDKVGAYSSYFVKELTYFYKYANIKELEIDFLIKAYQSSLTAIPVEATVKKGVKYIRITQEPIDLLGFLSDYANDDEPAKTVYNNLAKIAKLIAESDEIHSQDELWKRYMIDNFLESYKPTNIKLQKTPKVERTVKPKAEQAEKTARESVSNDFDKKLKGKETEIPAQKGKVQKLFIPKLSLPSPYPVLTKSSRINSDYRVQKFSPADKTIHEFSIYRFKAVHYSTGFLEKRRIIKKTKPKFSFDF